MNALLIALLVGLIGALAPLLSLGAWSMLLYLISPYVRKSVGSLKEGSLEGGEFRDIVISLSIHAFILSAIISATLAVIISLIIFFPALIFEYLIGTSGVASLMLSLISAGPVEESTKLLVSFLLFLLITWMLPRVRPGSKRIGIRDGIMIGLFVGASFGAIESFLYLIQGATPLLIEPLVYENADPIIFRIVLGVSIHAVWTGISSAALGERKNRIPKTLLFLFAASLLHSMNNGIQGAILIVAGLDGLFWLMVVNVFQITFVVVSAALLWTLWNRRPSAVKR